MPVWYRAVDDIEIPYLAVECNGPMAILKGDMDVSGIVDGGDIPAFVAAAISNSSLPGDVCPGDFKGDGVVSSVDVAGFSVAVLSN